MSGRLLLYGATGFSGSRLAARLADLGPRLVLGGRDPAGIAAVAGPLGLGQRTFDCSDPRTADDALTDVSVLLNCAGPFTQTAAPLIDACLRTGVDYLDISGEWPVFDHAMALAGEAARAGVMLMPGAGFANAVTDCLLALAALRVRDPVRLRLGLSQPHAMSAGSLATLIGLASPEVLVRRSGKVERTLAGRLTHDFDFGRGAQRAVAVSWPDVLTGELSTGVANIAVYSQLGRMARLVAPASAASAPLLGHPLARAALRRVAAWAPESAARHGFTLVVETEDRWRRTTRMTLATLDGYATTTAVAEAIARRVLGGTRRAGFATASRLLGPGFILTMPDTIALADDCAETGESRHAVR